MPRRPVAVAFDVIETLFSLEKLRPKLVDLGLPPAALELWFTRTLRDAFALDAAGSFKPFPEVAAGSLGVLCAMQGVAAPGAAVEGLLRSFAELEAQPDVAPAFTRLREAGIRIAALSNGTPRNTRQLLERAGLLDRVERVVSIEDVRRWKPRREVYTFTAGALSLPPEQVALVAVHAWDVQGAGAAGLVTGWASRLERIFHPTLPRPDVTGTDLVEVVERLAALPT